jgi:uncharacterized protein
MQTPALTPLLAILLLFIGAATGVFSGLFGVGGGVILVPILVFFFQFSPQAASGTSLVALLLPVGLLGVLEYFQAGKINREHLKIGLLVALGIFLGTYIGARLGARLSGKTLQRAFAVFLVFVAARLWLSTGIEP